MNMMMHVLDRHQRNDGLRVLAIRVLGLVLELGDLGSKTNIPVALVIVFDRAALNWQEVVVVLLLEGIGVCDWLDGGVVVLLACQRNGLCCSRRGMTYDLE